MPIITQDKQVTQQPEIQEMVVVTRSSKEKNTTRKKRVLKEDTNKDIDTTTMNVKKVETIIKQFREQGINILEKMKEKELQEFY